MPIMVVRRFGSRTIAVVSGLWQTAMLSPFLPSRCLVTLASPSNKVQWLADAALPSLASAHILHTHLQERQFQLAELVRSLVLGLDELHRLEFVGPHRMGFENQAALVGCIPRW